MRSTQEGSVLRWYGRYLASDAPSLPGEESRVAIQTVAKSGRLNRNSTTGVGQTWARPISTQRQLRSFLHAIWSGEISSRPTLRNFSLAELQTNRVSIKYYRQVIHCWFRSSRSIVLTTITCSLSLMVPFWCGQVD